jgi:ABC-type multidrug transport system ATPase subunit
VSVTLAAERITKAFAGRQVLASAGLWARAGSVTALLGLNGSGKTTLLRIAAGWLRPDAGVVSFRGRAYERPRLARLARAGLFFLPDRDLLQPTVRLDRHFRALRRSFPGARVEEAAALLEIDGLFERRPRDLASGERRRAEVALALAREPACLLADEPLRGLEPADRRLLAGVLRELARSGCAVVVAGQEARDLLAFADEVYWQVAGTTQRLGTAAEALEDTRFRRQYLGAH